VNLSQHGHKLVLVLCLLCLPLLQGQALTKTTKLKLASKKTLIIKKAANKKGDLISEASLKNYCRKGKASLSRSDFKSRTKYNLYIKACNQEKAAVSKKATTKKPHIALSPHASAPVAVKNAITTKTSASDAPVRKQKLLLDRQKRISLNKAVIRTEVKNSESKSLAPAINHKRGDLKKEDDPSIKAETEKKNELSIAPRPGNPLASPPGPMAFDDKLKTKNTLQAGIKKMEVQDIEKDTRQCIESYEHNDQKALEDKNFKAVIGNVQCCQILYQRLEKQFFDELDSTYGAKITNEHVTKAAMTVKVLPEVARTSLLSRIVSPFKSSKSKVLVEAQRTRSKGGKIVTINIKNKKGELQQLYLDVKEQKIRDQKHNAALYNAAIKVVDSFIDDPQSSDLKNRLLVAFLDSNVTECNQILAQIRTLASSNYQRASEIFKAIGKGAKAKVKSMAANQRAQKTVNENKNKLIQMCPEYDFTIFANYTVQKL